MSLDLTQFKADLVALSVEVRDAAINGTPKAFGYWEEQFAILVDAYIQSGTVNTTVPGVQSGGSTAAGTGSVT